MTFPSVLRTSGRNLVDSGGNVMPLLKGFNVQPVPWSAQTYTDMYNEGARIIRTIVFWDELQPNRPASATDYSTISSTYVTTKLDLHIQRLTAAGMYTVFNFYFGPQITHMPNWAGSTPAMGNYITWGQSATQYLAKRYGDSSNPLGAPDAPGAVPGQGQYTAAVIGLGLNEITPDTMSTNSWLVDLYSQQATMISWFRAFAPDWIGIISSGFGASAPYANAPGSGHVSDQTFTTPAKDAFASVGGNIVLDMHDYLMASTDGTDGRTANGGVDHPRLAKTHDTAYPSYPPVISGTALSRAACQSDQAKYIAPYIAYCAAAYADCPLFFGEWGWAPVSGTTTFTGGSAWIADKLAGWAGASPAVIMQWDYGVNQTQDILGARPSSGIGCDANGWQTVTNLFFASGAAAAALSGQGTLSAAGLPRTTAGLSGTGSLSAAPAFRSPAPLSGTGTLRGAWGAAGQGSAALSGSGTLTARVAAMGLFSLVQAGPPCAGTGSVALTCAGTHQGNLLAALVLCADPAAFSPPGGGWRKAGSAAAGTAGHLELWYLEGADDPGGISSVTFTGPAGKNCRGALAEFALPAGYKAVLESPGQASGTGGTMTLGSAAGNAPDALGITAFADFFGAATAGTWTGPAGAAPLASAATAASNWYWAAFTALAQGNQSFTAGFSNAAGSWCAALAVFRAVRFDTIHADGGEMLNFLAPSPDGQVLIAAGDAEGLYRSPDRGDHWQVAQAGLWNPGWSGVASVAWSVMPGEAPSTVYACLGQSGSDGAFAVSPDGGSTWTIRSTVPNFWGNSTRIPPRPSAESQDSDRSVGHLIAQDPVNGYLYVCDNTGAAPLRSTDLGATWTSIGGAGATALPAPAYVRGITLNPDNPKEGWVCTWKTTTSGASDGGVWHCTDLTAAVPAWNQKTGYTGTVADLKVIGSGSSAWLYAAANTAGLYRAPVSPSGPLASLNGGGTTASVITDGTAKWNSADGYADTAGNHVLLAAVGDAPRPAITQGASLGPFGCSIIPLASGSLNNSVAAEQAWGSIVATVGCAKQYFTIPAPYSATNHPDGRVWAAANQGHSIAICLRPTYSTTDTPSLANGWGITAETLQMVQYLSSVLSPITSIGYPGFPDPSKVIVILEQEPNNGGSGKPSALAYWRMVNFHQAGIRQPASKSGIGVAGYPGLALYTDLTANSVIPEKWFPGPQNPLWPASAGGPGGPCAVDGYWVDEYANNYINGTHPDKVLAGASYSHVQLADLNNIPFGFGEIGNLGASTGTVPDLTQMQNFLVADSTHSVKAIMQAEISAGRNGGGVLWYQNNAWNNGNNSFSYTATSNAAGAVFTAAGISSTSDIFRDTDEIILDSGAPGGYTAGKMYWVVNAGVSGADTFQLAASNGGAPVPSTSSGSGTLEVYGQGAILQASDPRCGWLQQIAALGGSGTAARNNYQGLVQLTIPPSWPLTGTITYTDLTNVPGGSINTATLPPDGRPWWRAGAGWQFWLGGSNWTNAHVILDPADTTRIYLTGSGGAWRSADSGKTWELAANGMPMTDMHAVAIDPASSDHYVTGGSDFLTLDLTDPAGLTGVVQGSLGLPGPSRESHAVAFDPSDSTFYLGVNQQYGTSTGGGVYWRAPGSPAGPWTDTGFGAAAGGAACIGLYAGRDASGSRFLVAVGQGAGIYRASYSGTWPNGTWTWTAALASAGTSGTVGQVIPFTSKGGSRIYCFDRSQGIWRSSDYGASWTLIWAKTVSSAESGWLAVNPDIGGDLWVSTTDSPGLYRLSGAGSGTVAGGQITVTAITAGPPDPGPVGFYGGSVYAVWRPTGSHPGTQLMTSADGGVTWADADPGGEIGQYVHDPRAMAVSADGRMVLLSDQNFGVTGTLAPVTAPPLTVTTTSLPAGAVGVAYTASLAAQGGAAPYTWALSTGSLPAGLNLDADGSVTGTAGTIYGTPAAAGSVSAVFQVTGSLGNTALSPSLTITISAAVLAITTTSLPPAVQGTAYGPGGAGAHLAAVNGTTPYTWSLNPGSALPGGLALSGAGVISGTPSAAGSFSFTVKVTDAGTPVPQTDTQALSVTVNPAPLTITTKSLPPVTAGVFYTATLHASGGTPGAGYRWSVAQAGSGPGATGDLPAGLGLNPSTGVISGTAATAGVTSVTFQVSDSLGSVASAVLAVVVAPPVPQGGAATLLMLAGGKWATPEPESQAGGAWQPDAVYTLSGGTWDVPPSG